MAETFTLEQVEKLVEQLPPAQQLKLTVMASLTFVKYLSEYI